MACDMDNADMSRNIGGLIAVAFVATGAAHGKPSYSGGHFLELRSCRRVSQVAR